jgi:uncharacterized protein (TIGR03083 family)
MTIVEEPDMDASLSALRASAERLRATATALDDAQLVGASYDNEWTIADVLSHLGSGAVIMQRRLRDAQAGTETPDEFAPSVWDEWNAKSPRAKTDDALVADWALVDALEAVSAEDRAALTFAMGPMTLDLPTFVGMRLNEHVFHTWDVEVALHGAATLAADAVPLVVDNLDLIARYTAQPVGGRRTIALRTTDPSRDVTVTVGADSVEYAASGSGQPDVVLPAEALCRLVYGRLDPDHTPAFTGDGEALDVLRRVFPGP